MYIVQVYCARYVQCTSTSNYRAVTAGAVGDPVIATGLWNLERTRRNATRIASVGGQKECKTAPAFYRFLPMYFWNSPN